MSPTALLLAQLVVLLLATRAGGLLAARLHQPRVMGELLAGLALGPSLLGALAPTAFRTIFPPDRLAPLETLSQVGVLLFLLSVGLRLDLGAVRARARTAAAASHASIAAPFVLGAALALWLPRALAGPRGGMLPYALFMGAALSVTAFPVLATIVEERGLMRTRLGGLALTAAAVDDVTAWLLLAGVVGVATGGGAAGALAATAAGLGVTAVAAVGTRAALHWLATRTPPDDASALAGAIGAGLALGWLSERAGVHALFGTFLAGTLVPRAGGFAEAVSARLTPLVTTLLLPTFFAMTGLRTSVALLDGPALWGAFALVLLVAVVGKVGASAVAARLAGESWRDAFALGALLNTRGLMAIVVATVGLDAGVVSPACFTLLVLIALVTTAMTGPLLTFSGAIPRTAAVAAAE